MSAKSRKRFFPRLLLATALTFTLSLGVVAEDSPVIPEETPVDDSQQQEAPEDPSTEAPQDGDKPQEGEGEGGGTAESEENTEPTEVKGVYVSGTVITVKGMSLSQLDSVTYQGRTLERGMEYTAHDGSVVIELKTHFLNYLLPGRHTLVIHFNNNTFATATFSLRGESIYGRGEQWKDYTYNENIPILPDMGAPQEGPPNINRNPGTGR